MAKMTVDELSSKLQNYDYTPRTDEELQTAAENRYNTVYNQKRQSANQSYQTQDLAYANQLQQLQNTLAQNQQDLAKQTENARLQAARYQITRGMQRSSYGAANDSNLMASGVAEQQKLLNQYGVDANGIGANRTLLAQQLADTLAQYDTDYMNDVLAYKDELEQTDYERAQAAKEAQNALEMQMFEYNRKYGSSSGGGGSSRRSSGGGSSTATATNDTGSSGLFDNLNSLNNGGDSSAYWSNSGDRIKATTASTAESVKNRDTSAYYSSGAVKNTYKVDTTKKKTAGALATIKANAASKVAANSTLKR